MRAGAQRLLMRLERIEAGEPGWQGTAWTLERIYPHRFARPEVMNQIAVVQGGKVIVLPSADFDALKGREGYRQRDNGDLERVE
jgi:hypothetical protein